MRGWISFNWFLGACFWILALLQPVLYNALIGAEKGTAEANVQQIAQKQGARSAIGQEGFVLFPPTALGMSRGFAQLNLSPPPADASFVYEVVHARGEDGAGVVVRAMPSAGSVRRMLLPLPPMVYELQLDAGGGGRWNEYGRIRPTLFGFL